MNARLRAKLATIQDLDRQRVEKIAALFYSRILGRAVRLATASYEVGGNVRQSLRVGLDPLRDQIKASMVLAHLEGMRRSAISVERWVKKGVRLSSAYDGAIEFLKQRLELEDADLIRLERRYGEVAATSTGKILDNVEQRVTKAILENVRDGGSTRDGVKAVRQAMLEGGVTPAKPYQIEAVVRTQTQLAYAAGRQNSLRHPAIQEILWGYEYAATVDDRTTELCASLDGTRLPKDDPFWTRYWPPNHWNCRSTALEIFNDEEKYASDIDPPDDAESPQSGFNFNPGDAYGDLVGVEVIELSRDSMRLTDPTWRYRLMRKIAR